MHAGYQILLDFCFLHTLCRHLQVRLNSSKTILSLRVLVSYETYFNGSI